jgi:hypothetical protein
VKIFTRQHAFHHQELKQYFAFSKERDSYLVESMDSAKCSILPRDISPADSSTDDFADVSIILALFLMQEIKPSQTVVKLLTLS